MRVIKPGSEPSSRPIWTTPVKRKEAEMISFAKLKEEEGTNGCDFRWASNGELQMGTY